MEVNIPEQLTLTVSLRGSREVRDGYQLFRLTGQLDAFSEPAFRRVMLRYLEEGPAHLILDLSAIDFMDSSGLGVLVQIAKKIQSNQGSLRIVTNPRVTQTVKLVRLEQFLSLVTSLEEAQAGLLSPEPTKESAAPPPLAPVDRQEPAPESNLEANPEPEIDAKTQRQDPHPSEAAAAEKPAPPPELEPGAIPRIEEGGTADEGESAPAASSEIFLETSPEISLEPSTEALTPRPKRNRAKTGSNTNPKAGNKTDNKPDNKPDNKTDSKTKNSPVSSSPATLETGVPLAIAPEELPAVPARSPAKTKTPPAVPPLEAGEGLPETPEKKPKSRTSRKRSTPSQPPV